MSYRGQSLKEQIERFKQINISSSLSESEFSQIRNGFINILKNSDIKDFVNSLLKNPITIPDGNSQSGKTMSDSESAFYNVVKDTLSLNVSYMDINPFVLLVPEELGYVISTHDIDYDEFSDTYRLIISSNFDGENFLQTILNECMPYYNSPYSWSKPNKLSYRLVSILSEEIEGFGFSTIYHIFDGGNGVAKAGFLVGDNGKKLIMQLF